MSLDRTSSSNGTMSTGKGTPSTRDRLRFSQLMAANRNALFAFLLKQGANPAVAEDCLQEALIRAYRSLHTLRDWNMAKSWLFGITKNVYLNEVRRAKVRSRPLPAEDPEIEPSADEQMELAERSSAIKDAISKLPPPRPEIIDLHYRKGMTLEEIGEKLGLPVGTVKTNLFRARAALRRSLGALEVQNV